MRCAHWLFLSLFLGGTASAEPRLGLNFMRYFWEREGDIQVDVAAINADVSTLGADAMRQLVRADLLWRDVEPQDDQWDFSRADAVLSAPPAIPIVTLFSMQYASPTPPWAQGPGAFRPVLGAAARDYVETVVRRYADKVRYWEIGNEMDHWRISDPGGRKHPPAKRPPHSPPMGFSPAAQGRFVAEVAAIIRSLDPDAVILMPGVGGLSSYVLETWLPGFLEGAGKDGFDVVNYHFYGPWRALEQRRSKLSATLKRLGIGEKAVWLTETGSTSQPVRSERRHAPTTPTSQAADVFRRTLVAWGAGDQAVFWHTLLSSPDRLGNRWRGFGLKDAAGKPKPAYAAFGLLGAHIAPHESVQAIAGLGPSQFGYAIKRRDGSERWVFWGQGNLAVSVPAKAYTSVMPNAEDRFVWRGVGASITLSDVPVLLRN